MRQVVDEELKTVRVTDSIIVKQDGYGDVLDRAEKRINQRLSNPVIEQIVTGMVKRANQQNHRQTVESINNTMGVDVSRLIMSNPEIRAKITLATQYNAQLIKSIQQDYLGRVRLTTLQASMQGVRHESIISDIRSIGNVTESRARLIARDQTSKLNGALTEVRQTSLGVEEYIWSASGDERVREDHKNNDGKRFKWSEPPPTGHPSHDVNCRCVAIPVIDIEGYPQ